MDHRGAALDARQNCATLSSASCIQRKVFRLEGASGLPDGCEIRALHAHPRASPSRCAWLCAARPAWISATKIDRFGDRRQPRHLRVAGLPERGRISNPSAVGTKSEHRAARELVGRYHENQLAVLLEHVADAIDAHRAGTLDVHDVDEVIHQYHRAARELWKFCWSGGVGGHIEIVARLIEQPIEHEEVDWWQRGAPRERGGR